MLVCSDDTNTNCTQKNNLQSTTKPIHTWDSKNQAKSTNNQQTPHVFHEKSLGLRTLEPTERNFRAFKDFCGGQAANVGINRVNLQTQQVWKKLLEWVEILAVSCRYHNKLVGRIGMIPAVVFTLHVES